MKVEFNAKENCFVVTELGKINGKLLSEFRFISKVIDNDTLKKRIEFILSRVKTHPELLKLLEEVLTKGSLKVEIVDHVDLTSTADYNSASRIIRIAQFSSEIEWLESFIFELCNADNPYYSALPDIASGQYRDARDYAMRTEKAEYHTDRRKAELLKLADKKKYKGWNVLTDKYEYFVRSEKEYLNGVQKPSLVYHGYSHIQIYEQHYLTLQYCEHELKIARTENEKAKLRVLELEFNFLQLKANAVKSFNRSDYLKSIESQISRIETVIKDANEHPAFKNEVALFQQQKIAWEQEKAKIEQQLKEDKLFQEKIKAEIEGKQQEIERQKEKVKTLEENLLKENVDIKQIQEEIEKLKETAALKKQELERFHAKNAKSVKKDLCATAKTVKSELRWALKLTIRKKILERREELQGKILMLMDRLPKIETIMKESVGFNAFKMLESRIADVRVEILPILTELDPHSQSGCHPLTWLFSGCMASNAEPQAKLSSPTVQENRVRV